MWSLKTGGEVKAMWGGDMFDYNEIYSNFCQEYMVLQDKWSVMAVVSQDSFHSDM